MPDLEAFPLALWRRLAARRMRIEGVRALGYPPALGHPALREALARHLGASRGLVCAPEQVMICNSAMQAIELCVRVLLERGDAAWIEDPGYPNLRTVLAAAGVRAVPVPLDGAGIDVARGVARHAHPALVVVTPACHYPTGVTMTLERRIEVLRAADACGAWIVEDDHQSEFVHRGRPVAALARLDPGRTLCVGSFSHVVFPSLRLAWRVLPPALVDVFEAVRRQLDDHTHAPLQGALADFIDGGHFAAHLRRMRTLYTQRRDALKRACTRALPPFVRLGPLDAGMTAALHLPSRASDRAVAARAAARGIVAVPLSRYATDANVNGLLLGYAALDERRIVADVAALARVLRA
jgi:GntR family transcriptional regulator/MocR family aminotransferase